MRAFVVALGAFALAGCGGEDGGDAGAPAGAPRETVEIRLNEFRLEPSTVTIDEPGVYVFRAVNDGSTVHALRLEGEGVEVETEQIGPGELAELSVELAQGTYELECPVGDHDDRGMVGSVSVGGAPAGTTGGDDGDGGYGGYGNR